MNPHSCQAALREVIAEAYRTFEHHAAPPFPLDVCLACCVSVEVEQQLRSWPLARLTAQHFYEYNCSAKSEAQPVQEIGHLLPRMLELLAKGDLDCDAPSSTAQFVEATYWHFWEHREYGNAFASDRPEFQARIRTWLLAPDHRKRFAEKLMAPDFQELASVHGPVGRMPFSLMVDGVFDQLVSAE